MHTESHVTRWERYATAHRTRVAVVAFLALSATLSTAWSLILPIMGVWSFQLVCASSFVITLGVAALAAAWHTEQGDA